MVFAENKPSTELFSFIFLKKLCSFALIIILIFYTYNQFLQLYCSITEPNINTRNFFNFKQGIDKDIKIIILTCSSLPLSCTYNNGECEEYGNDLDVCENGDHTYRYAFNYQDMAEITPFITEAYLAGLVIDNKYFLSEEFSFNKPNSILLVNEQINVIYYSFTISKRIVNDYAYGLAGGEEEEHVVFISHTDHITTLKTTNTTRLILIPATKAIQYQEEFYYDLGSIISNVGGFVSSLSGFFVFLFGANKLAPWGFFQTYVFKCLCIRYQKKLIKKLKTKYEPIPFVNGRTKNVTLEERVQNIENILKEYYLDTDFLNSLLTKYNKVNDNEYDDKV